MKGFTSEIKNSSAKYKRLIIVQAGTEDELIDGADQVIRVKKGYGDYRQELDGKRFEARFCKLVPTRGPTA